MNHRLLVFLHSFVAELTGGKDAHRLQRKISEIKVGMRGRKVDLFPR